MVGKLGLKPHDKRWVIAVFNVGSWRWAAPVAVAAAIGTGLGVNGALSASASPTLPTRTPAQLLAAVDRASGNGAPAFSGTIVENAKLGLPDLPSNGSSSDLSSLVTGSHTLRVWVDGPDKARLALLGTLGESDVIHNGKNLWEWSSKQNLATHYTLGTKQSKQPATPQEQLTPQQTANRLLRAVSPTTKVTTDGTTTVAGRSAYVLSLAPRDQRSLIGSVRIAVDANTYMPLRVQIFAAGASGPAFEVGFTHVSFATPSAAEFSFATPPGARVKEGTLGGHAHAAAPSRPAAEPKVIGKGWTTVLVVPGVKQPRNAGSLSEVLGSMQPVSGTWGTGRLLRSSLVSALLTDDGRLLVGAVPPSQLYAAAQR